MPPNRRLDDVREMFGDDIAKEIPGYIIGALIAVFSICAPRSPFGLFTVRSVR